MRARGAGAVSVAFVSVRSSLVGINRWFVDPADYNHLPSLHDHSLRASTNALGTFLELVAFVRSRVLRLCTLRRKRL
ncbi:uncharacterized protein B0H18DRAFT_1062017 [Fomitopsis serialis]|uniref:uncharacterized protein n=1 Tax=Fomitopsis serialis TaxID=139415 RepID=UPI002008A3C4|nr:uncharacterized protein B0H18DRAFT_1069645 [Neoantrodia serialis]XP_047884882.1 uncharacterized protein B0H18DRAFT_1063951 [Neoantrodia serialis]XP_047885014.1 uncharacterized protein B0H18DRAFT_1062017 [Neoantrodia serialis]KAH9910434.1 hypothetical protein B0H18DRAFT_1069645 [Neoantrodia serialis]KAH9911252.1 hypothetical protein B0H18DRAFT_1063951 [Neoantrodia serialis]KAH9911525.1 hypothetical protein B0H18DRAFT_1062017 [Neoantrodia serialis]